METNSNKPPVGIKPRWLHDMNRAEEIVDAMVRYIQTNTPIPISWVKELRDLLKSAEFTKMFFLTDLKGTSGSGGGMMLSELSKKEIRDTVEHIKTFVTENLDEWYIKQEILDNLKRLTILLEHNDLI